MRKTCAIAALSLLLSLAAHGAAPAKPPEFRLGDAVRPLGYQARLAIDPESDVFEGRIEIALDIRRPQPVLWLNATDLTIVSADFEKDGRRVELTSIAGGEDFVGFAGAEPLPAGEAKLVVRYRGKIDSLSTEGIFRQKEGTDWYVLSQFEAISARRAWPCFDEPGWKTPWQLTLDVPEALVAVSNTPIVDEKPLDGGRKRITFKRTAPLPAYLIALGVGPFDVVEGGVAGKNRTPLRYFVPRGRAAEARYAKEVTGRLVELLEDYFGIPYPFEKLDSVVIPTTVGFGAMENVGMITYASSLLQAKPNEETDEFKRRYAGIAAHEIAHQWFGDLVTLAWWDDTWLNEAFASWLGQMTLYRFQPEWDDGLQRALSRGRAIALDRLASTRRVRNPVESKGEIWGAFDSITYQKGSQVLAMFETAMTPAVFRDGVRSYLQTHAFGNATSRDFAASLARAGGGRALIEAFEAFIGQPGVPLIDVALDCAGKPALVLTPARFKPAGSKIAGAERWSTPACFRHGRDGKMETTCGTVSAAGARLPLAACPDWALGNAGGSGYYVARYAAPLRAKIDAHAASLPVPEATAMLNDTALMVESGLMPVDDLLAAAERYASHPSPVVRHRVVQALRELRLDWLDEARYVRFDRIMARQILPAANELGWLEKEGEDRATRELRVVLLPLAADRGRSPALRAQAAELARRWMERHDAIPESIVDAVLAVTAAFADASTFARMERSALAEKERRERVRLRKALVATREPPLRAEALALALDQRVEGRDCLAMVEAALVDDDNRPAAFAFVRENFDALVARVPKDTPGHFISESGKLCTPTALAEFQAFFKERAAKFNGGPRRYRQALERIEVCVAARPS
jgi:alanyl aminopeptidase